MGQIPGFQIGRGFSRKRKRNYVFSRRAKLRQMSRKLSIKHRIWRHSQFAGTGTMLCLGCQTPIEMEMLWSFTLKKMRRSFEIQSVRCLHSRSSHLSRLFLVLFENIIWPTIINNFLLMDEVGIGEIGDFSDNSITRDTRRHVIGGFDIFKSPVKIGGWRF